MIFPYKIMALWFGLFEEQVCNYVTRVTYMKLYECGI